jgi:beta-lactamase class D
MPEENFEDNGWPIGYFQQNLDAYIFPTNLSVVQVFFHHVSRSKYRQKDAYSNKIS